MRTTANSESERRRARAGTPDEGAAEPLVPPGRPWGKVALGAVVLAVLSAGIWIFGAWVTGRDSDEVVLQAGETVDGVIGPETAMAATRKPYIDYALEIHRTGDYEIVLHTNDADRYDPFLALLREGNIVASNDHGGFGNNAVIRQRLTPGTYTMRVTRYTIGQLREPASFRLSVTDANQIAEAPRGIVSF